MLAGWRVAETGSELRAVLKTARLISPRTGAAVILAALCLGLVVAFPDRLPIAFIVAAGLSLVAVVLATRGMAALAVWREGREITALMRLMANDATPC